MRLLLLLLVAAAAEAAGAGRKGKGGGGGGGLRFRGGTGTFKVVQVADMHYADGRRTGCLDVLPSEVAGCSDLNTTAFLYRLFRAEDPDLVVFTGDNIYGADATDAAKSMDAAIAPAIDMKLPWAAVIGNHDQEGTLSREGVMRHLVGMKNTLSRFNPKGIEIDGYGNYNLEVGGVEGTLLANKSVLNLYFLDSGDYSTVPSIGGYGWIKASQQFWFQQTSSNLQTKYTKEQPKQKEAAPGLVYFHIPLPEFSSFTASNFTGVKQEGISSPSINSGFFASMVEAGDVKAAFIGHDHVNDFCGKLSGIQLCYAGGFGYHAYGQAGWSRRARVVSVQLEKTDSGEWRGVKSIKTWKRLDDPHLTTIDSQILWNRGSNGRRKKNPDGR
ncbi:probable inactive purple acid phosphatase 29 isoform X2 [Oryza brachyantha]|uniref:probable inactive purple acid phosphatase 29 isoform X2 n=1 Tax=Oryza brachyantha TaxID=4533 RepID=UPI001ADC1F14|nr:probable inactive purple acid phosphatase 29 isoform X2 [Oryza brachyantha]